jgi:hypothetical protein
VESTRPAGSGHVFISYVHEDDVRVDELQRALEEAGIKVWRDRGGLRSGQQWQIEIRDAIQDDNCRAFLACFSERLESRVRSYQHVELGLAAEEMKMRPPGATWLIPVRFAECRLPHLDLGYGRTLDSLQRVDLFGRATAGALDSLIADLRERAGILAPGPMGGTMAGGAATTDGKRTRYPGKRVRGSTSPADTRTWLLSAMLGVVAAVGAVVALWRWPSRCVPGTVCPYAPAPGRGVGYVMIGLSLAVIASSLAEGPRARRAARWTRLIASLACALALAGVAQVQNFAPSWIIALAALGGLALIAVAELADMLARLGGTGLLAGSMLLLAGLVVPKIIGLGVPTFGLVTGFAGYARWIVALIALLLGIGWYYRWPDRMLAIVTVMPAGLAIYGIPGRSVVGPYVVLVACSLLLVTIAMNAENLARPSFGSARGGDLGEQRLAVGQDELHQLDRQQVD